MMRALKNCFIFGRIGVKPARLVFGETEPAPAPPPAPETNEARESKEATDSQLEKAKTDLSNKIAALEQTVDKEVASPNPAIKAAALRAKEELAKIKPTPGQNITSAQVSENLGKIEKIPAYMKECRDCEKPLEDNRKLVKENVTPLLAEIEERFSKYVNNPAYAKLSEAAKAEIAKMRDDTMAGVNKAVESILPLTVSGRLSLDEYIKDNAYFKNQLKKENDLLKNTESDLYTKIEEETQRVANMDAEQLAVCYTDIAQNEANAGELVNKIKTGMTKTLEETNKTKPLDNLDALKQELAKICDDTNTKLLSPELKGPENSERRALIMARMRDQLLEFTAKVNKSEVEKEQKDSCVIALVRRAGLPAGMDAAAVAKELGVDEKVINEAAKGAAPSATPPPVSGEGPVKPAATTEPAPSAPQLASVIRPEMQASIDRLGNEELRTLVASAPGEVRDAMLKIAQYGENPGQMIKFKILLSKTQVDCYFVKEGNGVYRFKRPDPTTGAMVDLFTYGTRMEALKVLHSGAFMQGMILSSLKNRAYYDAYEKKGLIDMKDGPTQSADPNSVIFRLDWKGLSNVSGNPVIRATALPHGGIAYTVNRDGVGLNGEKVRNGLASNMADLFRQLNHLQGWAEGSGARKEKPAQVRQAEIAYEAAYSQMNDPANFYAHQDRIGRPVYFGINTINGDTDMALDWGGGLSTDTEVNPYVRMRLGRDGRLTYRIEYKGETTDSRAPVATVGQVIDAVAAYRALKMNGTFSPASPWSPERWAAHVLNPLAVQPEVAPAQQVAAAPGVAPALQTPGTAPGGAPQVAPGAPVAGAETTAGRPAVPAGGPAGGPAEGAKTPEGPAEKAKNAAKKAEDAKKTAESAQKKVGEIVSGAQGKDEEVVNNAITAANAEAEKAKNAAEEARKAAEEAKKAVDEQKTKAEAAKKTADKAEAEKAPNSGALRTQSRAETASLTEANKALVEADKSDKAASIAATEATRAAESLKVPPAAPATAPAK